MRDYRKTVNRGQNKRIKNWTESRKNRIWIGD